MSSKSRANRCATNSPPPNASVPYPVILSTPRLPDLTLPLAVMQARLEREAPKVTTVGTAQFSTRVAALRASRLEAEELPEGLRPEAPPSPGRWPRRTPSPSKDCQQAIVRGEMGHRCASIQSPWSSHLHKSALDSDLMRILGLIPMSANL